MSIALKSYPKDDRAGIDDAIAVDGACIVLDLLDEKTCDDLVADFVPHLESQEWGLNEHGYRDEFYGDRTKRLHGLFDKSSRMEALVLNPFLLKLARDHVVSKGESEDVRLSNTELMALGQDQPVQELHSDAGSWYHAQKLKKPKEILMSANIALTEFTATNGATCVVPGSHLWEDGRVATPNETCRAVMPKGAALLYGGNVHHGGGANTENEVRIGLYLGYSVSWLRPLENYLLTNNPADILSMSEDARRLLNVSSPGFDVIA